MNFYLILIGTVNIVSMLRRIIGISIVSLLGISLVFVFFFLRKKSADVTNPLKAIPLDAALILQINDFQNFETNLLHKNKIWNDLEFIPSFEKIEHDIAYFDTLSRKDSQIAGILEKSKIFISAHFIGGRKTEFLYIIADDGSQMDRNSIALLSHVLDQNIRDAERKYEGISIYTVKVNRNEQTVNYYLTLMDGHLLISKSVILIENAIRQNNLAGALSDDPDFIQVAGTAGKNKDANLYIDFTRFPGLLSNLARENLSQAFRGYKNFAGWAEFDINVSEKLVMLNGFIGAGSSEDFLILCDGNHPVKIVVDKVLPSSISAFLSIGGDDITKLNNNFRTYLTGINRYAERENRLKELESKYIIKFEEVFLSLTDDEITLAHGGYNERGMDIPASYVLVKCKSGSQAEKSMNNMVSAIATKKGINPQALQELYSVDNDTRFNLTKFPLKNITGLLFGEIFGIEGNTYFTFLGNYLVFSDSKDALAQFLYSNVLSRTLSTSAGYKNFSSNINQESNILFYTNLSRSSSVFRNYLQGGIMNAWEENYDKFQKIQSVGFQITEVSDMCYGNILFQYSDDYRGKPQTVWESLLDTSLTFKPQLTENHYTRQKEIFLQDQNNTIYLINAAGRILWKQRIAEPINSEVEQVDYFKNGKLQFLFSTDNYLHLIDRNGNYVERYPIRLREKASAGMALFDYEGSKDYRIFIPCIDKNVYAYSIDGNIIPGWEFTGSDHEVTTAVCYFRVEDKDFIVFGDKYRTYILDRRGKVRVPLNEIINKSARNTYYLDNKGTLDKSRIVTTDTSGHILSISFEGKVSIQDAGNFSADHYFDLKDVNADSRKDYIFLDRDRLVVLDQDESRILDFNFPNDLQYRPIYFRFSYNDRKLGFVDSHDSKIYLINNDGSLYRGFPLDGNTMFSIGYLDSPGGEFNLIVGGSNNFLYNYSVQ